MFDTIILIVSKSLFVTSNFERRYIDKNLIGIIIFYRYKLDWYNIPVPISIDMYLPKSIIFMSDYIYKKKFFCS